MLALSPDYSGYNGFIALLDAAWNALIHTSACDLSMRSISRAAGAPPSLIHRHFKSKSALFGEVAGLGLGTLWNNLEDTEDLPQLTMAWLKFAAERPRHHELMFAFEYRGHPSVDWRLEAVMKQVRARLDGELGRPSSDKELLIIFCLLLGLVSAVVSIPRDVPLNDVYAAVRSRIAAFKKTPG